MVFPSGFEPLAFHLGVLQNPRVSGNIVKLYEKTPKKCKFRIVFRGFFLFCGLFFVF